CATLGAAFVAAGREGTTWARTGARFAAGGACAYASGANVAETRRAETNRGRWAMGDTSLRHGLVSEARPTPVEPVSLLILAQEGRGKSASKKSWWVAL